MEWISRIYLNVEYPDADQTKGRNIEGYFDGQPDYPAF